MKLDLDFIKDILVTLEENPKSRMTLGELLEKLDIQSSNDEDMDRLAYHLRTIGNASFIDCPNSDFGFKYFSGERLMCFTAAPYEITLSGHQLLEALRNDNLMTKIQTHFQEIGITELKKIPSYLISVAMELIQQ